MESHPLEDYLRKNALPHMWCPGCGNGIVLGAFLRAIKELNFDINKLVVVSGIGCIGRISSYIDSDAFHTTHGRPIALATGVKIAKPDLNVVVISGDGDLFAIGGNHFVHAARRNMDLKIICVNNFIYGMTGGQVGPTTPSGIYTTTTPYGSLEHPFNLVHLAAGSGAVYVARWTVLQARALIESIKKTFEIEGFTFIEVISMCPTYTSRYSKMANIKQTVDWLKKSTVTSRYANPADANIVFGGKILCGEFVRTSKVTYTQLLEQVRVEVDKRLKKEEKMTLAKM